MSENVLRQRHLFETRIFEIQESGVKSTIKSPLRLEVALIPYENITLEPYEFSRFSRATRISMFFSLIFAVGCFVGATLGEYRFWIPFVFFMAIFFVRLFLFRSHFVIYGYGQKFQVSFLKDKPNKNTYDKFVGQMQIKKNSYLRERYLVFQFNSNNPSHIQTIYWLKSMGAMKQEEIEKLTKDYPIAGQEF